MIERWIEELPHKFPSVAVGPTVVMPNHVHALFHIEDNPSASTVSLATVIQWLKTMTTNAYIRGVKECRWPPFDRRLWQRNYWEHIIRDEAEYVQIAEYILMNPLRWAMDSLHPFV